MTSGSADAPPAYSNSDGYSLLREQIRHMLSQLGWSAAELARRSGVSPSTVTRALDASSPFQPSSRTLDKLLGVLFSEMEFERHRRLILVEGARQQEVEERIDNKVEQINEISKRYGLFSELASLFSESSTSLAAIPLVGLVSPGRWETAESLKERLRSVQKGRERLILSLPGEVDELVCYRFEGERSGLEWKKGDLLVCKVIADQSEIALNADFVARRTLGGAGLEEITMVSSTTATDGAVDLVLQPALYAGGVADAGPTVRIELLGQVRAVLSVR